MTLVARITFLVLVGATFAAFFVAQRLKSSPPVIEVNRLARAFSPEIRGNDFSVTLKVADDVTVDIVNLDGDRIARLADAVPVAAHRPLRLDWKGTRDDGTRAPDGRYRVRVSLRREGRSSVIQKTMTLDTKAPISVVCVGTPCRATKDFKNIVAPSQATVPVYVKGVSTAYVTRLKVFRTDVGPPAPPKQVGAFTLSRGKHVKQYDVSKLGPGTYIFQASVRDRAGNVGTSSIEPGATAGRPGLTVRGLAVQPPLRPVTAGQRADFNVDSRGARYIWRVRRVGESAIKARGHGNGASLSFRAPGETSGAYLLEVTSGRWHTSVPFLVQSPKRSSVLVVVPAISWLGSDKVDDQPLDGIPNSLTDGSNVHWPRVFTGLPPQFSDDVSKLLVFLDRRRIRYDLTSDLDLDLSRNPRASDRAGVLLAGPETWITRSLAHRLRRYVLDGGRVASIGADSMRRGVTLRASEADDTGVLTRPTQPASTDPFGAHLTKLRTLGKPSELIQLEGDSVDLMTGVTGLPGFTRLEESLPVAGERTLLAGVGEALTPEETAQAEQSGKPARELRPALTAVQVGGKKGLVIRVGLPEWYAKLGDANVAQATRNIIDLLRGVKPKIRSEG